MPNNAANINMPPLAQYRELSKYEPVYGDYLVWAGFFSTWFGVIHAFDPKRDMLEVIFEGLPILLVTMSADEYAKRTRAVPLSKLKNAHRGVWSVIRHEQNAIIWYV